MESFIENYKESREKLVKRLQLYDAKGNHELFTQIKLKIRELDVNFYSVQNHTKVLFENLP